MLNRALLGLYSAMVWAAKPLVRAKLHRRARQEPLYGLSVDERFSGRYGSVMANDPARPLIWIHAVSLGETRAAAILLKALRERLPEMRLLLTHGTATGREEGTKLLQAGDVQAWQPWDTAHATTGFFNHFQPAVGLLMETEVWPNWLAVAQRHGVPVCLVNARLSEKSMRQALRIAALSRPAYASLSHVWAQTLDDTKRLMRVGAHVDAALGNLKFDITPDSDQLTRSRVYQKTLHKPVVMLASSREGEEVEFLAQLLSLPSEVRNSVHWLIVPRHPQRFDEVADLVPRTGLTLSRRGAWRKNIPDTVWLGDSVGEMVFYYRLASVALLGGSFAPLGGQNLIEALACGCPVVMGPHTFNFKQAAQLSAAAGVAFEVDSLHSGVAKALQLCLLEDAHALGETCSTFVKAHRGAAKKTAEAVALVLAKQTFETTFAAVH